MGCPQPRFSGKLCAGAGERGAPRDRALPRAPVGRAFPAGAAPLRCALGWVMGVGGNSVSPAPPVWAAGLCPRLQELPPGPAGTGGEWSGGHAWVLSG